MDAFEQIIGKLLEDEGYWVRQSVKINLTLDEKKSIGKPSAPRPEIDIAAFDVKKNILILIEVKSFLDSRGVSFEQVIIKQTIQEGKYKLLTSKNYREVLISKLTRDWIEQGQILNSTQIKLGLVAGKIQKNQEMEFEEYFNNMNWFFWGPSTIANRLRKLEKKGYENNIITMVAKILRSE